MIHKNEGNTLKIEREEEMREELRSLICNFAIIDGEVQNELDKKLKKKQTNPNENETQLTTFGRCEPY